MHTSYLRNWWCRFRVEDLGQGIHVVRILVIGAGARNSKRSLSTKSPGRVRVSSRDKVTVEIWSGYEG
jgi:hypothetical protein